MTFFALTGFALLFAAPPVASPTAASSLITKLYASGRRPAEPITWALLDAYEKAPAETLRATVTALVRRCDNSVTEEALQRILKQAPALAVTQLAETAPVNLCVVRAIDALNRHPRVNASVGARQLIAALDSVDKKVRVAALDALTAPAFANDPNALALIRAAPRLAALMDDSDDETRFRGTAVAILLSGDASHPQLPKLLSLRGSRNLSIRQRAQEVLAQFGRAELRDDFRDITECVGAFRAVALRNGPDETRKTRAVYGEAIAGAVDSENAYCRIFAFEFLGGWPDGPDPCAHAKRLIRKEKVDAVRVAMRGACFQRAGIAKDETWLTDIFMRSPNRFHKATAARALLRSANPSARQVVVKALTHKDRDVRWMAAQAFVDERSRWANLHRLLGAGVKDATVQREFEALGKTAAAVLPAVSDADWYVRNNAALALQEATGADFGTHAKRWKLWFESTSRSLSPKPE